MRSATPQLSKNISCFDTRVKHFGEPTHFQQSPKRISATLSPILLLWDAHKSACTTSDVVGVISFFVHKSNVCIDASPMHFYSSSTGMDAS
jgi:hypothetical protein